MARLRGARLFPVPARACLTGALAVGLAVALSACGASTALGNAELSPLAVLPATDVIFETNLQSAVQVGETQIGLSAVSGSSAGIPETSGPQDTTSEVSVAHGSGVAVYTAFNPVDRHCLGTLVLSAGAPAVLGESLPGSYDFWFGPTTADACTASNFTAQTSVPSGWASGDPSSTGWPSP